MTFNSRVHVIYYLVLLLKPKLRFINKKQKALLLIISSRASGIIALLRLYLFAYNYFFVVNFRRRNQAGKVDAFG